jgi:hypothetical protein
VDSTRFQRRLGGFVGTLALAVLAAGPLGAQPAVPPSPSASAAPPAPPASATARPPRAAPAAPASAQPALSASVAPIAPAPDTWAIPARNSKQFEDLCKSSVKDLLAQRDGGAGPTAEQAKRQVEVAKVRDGCVNLVMRSAPTAGSGEAIADEVLRSVAQVVANRATRAGWELLRKKVRETARCDDGAKSPFPAMCRTLDTVAIQDLVSSPAVLLQALTGDFLSMARPDAARGWMAPPILDDALREAAARWGNGGAPEVASGLKQALIDQVRKNVVTPSCDALPSAAEKAMWVVGMCLIEGNEVPNFSKCSLDAWTSQCSDDLTTQRIRRMWSLAGRVFPASGAPRPTLADYVQVVTAEADLAIDVSSLADAQKADAHAYVGGMKTVLLGVANKDWVQSTSGAITVIRVLTRNHPDCGPSGKAEACAALTEEQKRQEKLFYVLAAVGNYAETLTKDTSGTGANAAAREKIIEDLVDRMTNRTDRESGTVFSVGGNLGLLGGVRTDFHGNYQAAFPVQLGLGVGLQTYHAEHDAGFHMMVTAFDLGQYVTFDNTALAVATPKLESAVSLGLTLGGWFATRETPFYVGAYGACSPFVRSTSDKITYQLGLTTGLYVPLLDFN